MGMAQFRDRTVDVWSVAKGDRSKIRSRMLSGRTQLVVVIKIRLCKCKDTRRMIKVWPVRAVMCNSTWTVSRFKACTQETSNKWVLITSRRSNRRGKQWQRTRLKLQIVHESLYHLQSIQTAQTMWLEWASRRTKMQCSWIAISLTKAARRLKITTQVWSIGVWMINSCWTIAHLKS